MLHRFLAALAAIMMFGLASASPALADKGKPGQIHWIQAESVATAVTKITDIIVRGGEARFGTKRNYTSFAFNPFTLELRLNEVVRPDGHNKNQTITTIVQLDSKLAVQRNEQGIVMARFQVGTEQVNGNAVLGTALANMLPALVNNVGAAAIQTAFSPCNGGGCGGGGGATAISISDAAAQTLFTGVFSGGCSTGTCGTTNTGHTDD